MSNPADPARIEELLSHGEWLRGLALRLVRDVARAEDLVQETWLAALRHPPREEHPSRAWLATVLRRLAGRRALGEARTRAREEAVARPESVPSTDELLAQVDTERRLAVEVIRLDEPFREAVLLRYRQGLTAAEIARRLGVPASTVRGRVQEGLARLRTRLDAAHPDRRTWCLALLRLLPGDTPPPVTTLVWTAGGLAMPLFLKLTAVFAVVALLTLVLLEPLGSPAPRSGEPPARTQIALQGGEDAAPVAPTRPTGPLRVAADASPGSGALRDGSSATDLLVRVTTETGEALPDARVVVGTDGSAPVEARTDADGTALFEPLEARGADQGWIGVVLPGRFPLVQRAQLGPGEVEVVISAGSVVAGLVVVDDAPPERPLGLSLGTDHPFPWESEVPVSFHDALGGRAAVASSDTAGAFRFEDLPDDWSGTLRVVDPVARGADGRPVERHLERPEVGLVLRVSYAPHLSGRVVEADGRTPVPHASVLMEFRGEKGSSSRSERADSEGRFTAPVRSDERQEVVVDVTAPDGSGRARYERILGGAPGAHPLGDLALAPSRALRFRVHDRDGDAIAGAVALEPESELQSTPTDEAGRGRLARVSGEITTLQFVAPGFEVAHAPLPADPDEVLDVSLERANGLEITLVDAERSPLPGLVVRLECDEEFVGFGAATHRASRWRQEQLPGTWRQWSRTGDRHRLDVVTDGEGRLAFEALTSTRPLTLSVQSALGTVVLHRTLPGIGPQERRSDELVLDEPLCELAGMVVDRDGDPLVEARVSVEAGPDTVGVAPELTEARTAFEPTDRAGRFRVDHLPAGPVVVRAELAGFATQTQELDLRHERNVEIVLEPARETVLELRDADGRLVAGMHATAHTGSAASWNGLPVGEGRYAFDALPEGKVTFRARVGHRTYETMRTTGEPRVVLRVPRPGGLEASWSVTPALVASGAWLVLYDEEGGRLDQTADPIAASGRHTFEPLAPGSYELALARPLGPPDATGRIELEELTRRFAARVASGEVARVSVHD